MKIDLDKLLDNARFGITTDESHVFLHCSYEDFNAKSVRINVDIDPITLIKEMEVEVLHILATHIEGTLTSIQKVLK